MLMHFKENLPEKPYVSSNLQQITIRPVKKAIFYEYIQANNPFNIRWLIFDVDRKEQSFFAWEEANLPSPNIIVKNPENANCHYFYMLKNPVWVKGTGRSKPENYLVAIKNAMTSKMHADYRYSGLLSKNPLHNHWKTTVLNNHFYELDELADYVDLETPKNIIIAEKSRNNLDNSIINGRNDYLFHYLREFAYQRINDYKKILEKLPADKVYQMWFNALLCEAENENKREFAGYLLPLNEIRNITKSIARWVWEKFKAEHRNRGVMQMGETRHNFNFEANKLSEEEKKERQRNGAKYTHAVRKAITREKIIWAIEEIKRRGGKVTMRAVSRFCKITVSNISTNYGNLFKKN